MLTTGVHLTTLSCLSRCTHAPHSLICPPGCCGVYFAQFKPGDKAFGCTEHAVPWSKFGTYAEYVSTHESTLQPIPSQLSFQEAAAVPLAAMTAWQAMEPSMPLQGKRVLVHAGAGGVLLLVQCIVSCSPHRLGPSRVVPWHTHPAGIRLVITPNTEWGQKCCRLCYLANWGEGAAEPAAFLAPLSVWCDR
jgi:threonine dehydrogenase-like Zn-dependent dehydrogenase